MPRLVITKGPGAGRDHAVGTEVVVGRAPDVGFVLEDNLVSRKHARVFREGDGYVVEDLGSRNGTWVNGRRAAHIRLSDGDTIAIGQTELSFRQKTLEQAAAGGKPVGPRTAVTAPVAPTVVGPAPVPPVRLAPPVPVPAKPVVPVVPVPPVRLTPPSVPSAVAPPPAGAPPARPPSVPGSPDDPPPPPAGPRKRRLIT